MTSSKMASSLCSWNLEVNTPSTTNEFIFNQSDNSLFYSPGYMPIKHSSKYGLKIDESSLIQDLFHTLYKLT